MATDEFINFTTGSGSAPDWWNIVLQQLPQAQYYSAQTRGLTLRTLRLGVQAGKGISSRGIRTSIPAIWEISERL